MRNPVARWSVWLTTTVITFVCLYAWKVRGIDPAGNLFLFWMWFVAAVGCILLLIPRKYAAKTTHPKIPSLQICDLATEIILVGLLAWFGHFVLAAVYVVGLLGRAANSNMYDQSGKLKAVSND